MRGLEEIQGLEVGTLIAGRYRVNRLLAKGAMGAVVAATHVELDELRAIKLLLPATAADPEMCERFLREARIAARLKSDHVVKVHEIGQLDGGLPFMVMEFLAGRDLRVIRKQRGPLPIEEATLYVIQACDALAEAHALGLVHRDVKPANLFLTHAGDGAPCIKVLDFGISKVSRAASLGVSEMQTSTGQMLGTPHYMPPEQMRGQRDVDARADIWAIGSLLYVLLTGRYPMHARSVQTVSLVLGGKFVPPLPSKVRRGLTPEIDPIIMRCLERDRDRRWPDVAELALALSPFAPPAAQSLVERIQRVLRGGTREWTAGAPASAGGAGTRDGAPASAGGADTGAGAPASAGGAGTRDGGATPDASGPGSSTGGVVVALRPDEPLPAPPPPSVPRAATGAAGPGEAALAATRAGVEPVASPAVPAEAALAAARAGVEPVASPAVPAEAALAAARAGVEPAVGAAGPGEAAAVADWPPLDDVLVGEATLARLRPRGSVLASRIWRLLSPPGVAAVAVAIVAVLLVGGTQCAEPPEQPDESRRSSGDRATGPPAAGARLTEAGSADSAGHAAVAAATPSASPSPSSEPVSNARREELRERAPRVERGPPARAAAAPRFPASRSAPVPGASARRQALSVTAPPR
ncbi:serine/threonine-protein kinase [Sorangium sp. So ce1182]|uniref:serine/threonine-protein kinase n=1 Tax=Sorangium sp. So ce1182 TaxID=3133334 RepID=UPI003F609FCB